MLKQLQKMKTKRILQKFDIRRLCPVAVQVLEVIDEASVLEGKGIQNVII